MWFDKFILFGDSITEFSSDQSGFALAPALQDFYRRKLDIVTRGFRGYNSDHGVIVLREVLKNESNVKLMYVFLGTNDATTTYQGVPIDRFESNLNQMVSMILEKDIKLIVVGPALHDQTLSRIAREDRNEMDTVSSSKATRQYADVAARVAHEHGVPFIDLWNVFKNYGQWSTEELILGNPDLGKLLLDGIHYTPEAYKLLYEELVEVISVSYPELYPDNLKEVFPYSADVDPENIEQSLMDSIKD